MAFGQRQSTVRVEPRPSRGGTKWLVRVDGTVSSRHNYKDTAVKEGRSKGRANNAVLKVFDTNMDVTETVNYQ